MSHSNTHDHAAHGHEHGHDEHPSHGSLRSYLTGFVLAAILTIIPFWLVMGHVFQSHWVTITLVLLLAVVQILVHVIYFLHLDTRSEGGWNMLSFIFTIVLVVIVLGASVWVMYTENSLMMPMQSQHQHGG